MSGRLSKSAKTQEGTALLKFWNLDLKVEARRQKFVQSPTTLLPARHYSSLVMLSRVQAKRWMLQTHKAGCLEPQRSAAMSTYDSTMLREVITTYAIAQTESPKEQKTIHDPRLSVAASARSVCAFARSDCLRSPVTGKCAKVPRKGMAQIQNCTGVKSLHVGCSKERLPAFASNWQVRQSAPKGNGANPKLY